MLALKKSKEILRVSKNSETWHFSSLHYAKECCKKSCKNSISRSFNRTLSSHEKVCLLVAQWKMLKKHI